MTRKPYLSDLPLAEPGGCIACRPARSTQRYLVPPAQWLPLAHVAPQLAPLGHRLVVFSPMAEGRDLGTDPRDLGPKVRETAGREPTPSAAIIDSQWVKITVDLG